MIHYFKIRPCDKLYVVGVGESFPVVGSEVLRFQGRLSPERIANLEDIAIGEKFTQEGDVAKYLAVHSDLNPFQQGVIFTKGIRFPSLKFKGTWNLGLNIPELVAVVNVLANPDRTYVLGSRRTLEFRSGKHYEGVRQLSSGLIGTSDEAGHQYLANGLFVRSSATGPNMQVNCVRLVPTTGLIDLLHSQTVVKHDSEGANVVRTFLRDLKKKPKRRFGRR